MPTYRQNSALVKIAGGAKQLDELLRNSVTSPFILKLRDVETGSSIVRVADLYFVIHADFSLLKTDEVFRIQASPPVEVGNMRFETRLLSPEELAARAIPASDKTWYVHSGNRMLDRIQVESTDKVVASKSAESLVVTSRTDPRFDQDEAVPNRWKALARPGGLKVDGSPQIYAGAGGYVKVSQLAGRETTLWVEAHFAFDEPRAWFEGAPILRSKLGLVAQDQIRRLRRELAKTNPK